MAKQRPQLTADTLRETKDDLMQRFADQARAWGCMPDLAASEAFIDPILRKVEVRYEEDRRADPLRVDEDAPRDGELPKEHVGTYDWNLGTDEVTAHPGSYMPEVKRAPSPEDVFRSCTRSLMRVPEFAQRLKAASLLCARHVMLVLDCAACRLREERFGAIMVEAYKRFGDPTKPHERKITVTGR